MGFEVRLVKFFGRWIFFNDIFYLLTEVVMGRGSISIDVEMGLSVGLRN